MISLIFVALLGASMAMDASLPEALMSTEKLVKLFGKFQAENGQKINLAEAPMRLRLFRNELKQVVETNENDLGWEAGLNFFADLTEDEKSQYLGLNMSITPSSVGEPMEVMPQAPGYGSKDWRSVGAVTAVKNQGSCGSCWTFAAVGSIEGVHKVSTGSLVTFAEQELLDCTYEGKRDGCKGGWYHDAFNYVKAARRLSDSRSTRYRGYDGRCSYSRVGNGLRATVQGYNQVPGSESGLVSALNQGPVSVAFQVTSQSQRYKSGLFRDTGCGQQMNHAVTAVGYTSSAIIVKNSWGSGWGNRGYIYFRRGGSNCGLYRNNAIVRIQRSSGQEVELEE